MSLSKLIEKWKSDQSIFPNITAWEKIPDQTAKTIDISFEISKSLQDLLEANGIKSLYSHQIKAWEAINSGKNIVIVTGTSSGKSLCFILPILESLLSNRQNRALSLYPTKALSQDQYQMIQAFTKSIKYAGQISSNESYNLEFRTDIYDGDTPSSVRKKLRDNSQWIISNPDMLHSGILPHHTGWANFFENLKFVVIDEIHTYRGVFGSHVANVIRRLKRIAHHYGADPIFILTSATIANPIEFSEKLIQEEITLIDEDGSPRGSRQFLIYNPPIVDPKLGVRKNILQESLRITKDCIDFNQQTIVFARSRRSVEMILRYLRTIHHEGEGGSEEIFRGYRSGYLPSQRREIEKGLRDGKIQVVISTNALELGIDIGGVGVTIMTGYPGTISATRQQAGRAGRGIHPGVALLITSSDPIDQYLAAHPGYFFEQNPEAALINPNNILILLSHITCAVYELPFSKGDCFGDLPYNHIEEYLDYLEKQGNIHISKDKYYWISNKYPASEISLRSASLDNFILSERGNDEYQKKTGIIGQIDLASVYWMVHPGAVYLHEAQLYLVEELDMENKTAYLIKKNQEYFTEPIKDINIQFIKSTMEKDEEKILRGFGEIIISTRVVGFKKILWETNEVIGQSELDLPTTELHTTGYWLVFKDDSVNNLRSLGLWTNDANSYGNNWEFQRNLARKRDYFTCQFCGKTEDKKQHDVHHIKPFRLFASFTEANSLENLVTLCKDCHNLVEKNVRIKSGLSGLSYILGHLAPLFLMCDVRDIGIHWEPQNSFYNNLPIILIFDEIPAGIGFSERLFDVHRVLLQTARETLLSCKCEDGCPSCVGPGGVEGAGSKQTTLALLEELLSYA